MRTTQTNRYARWAAILAVLVAAVVLIIYVRRSHQVQSVKKNAPPPVPSSVQRASQGFTLSKVEHDRTIVTVRASSATVYKEGDHTLLNDVWITVYGRNGDQNDNIHTKSCDYVVSAARITCPGEVDMDLESAEDANRASSAPAGSPPPRIIHVVTSKLTYDNSSGSAATDQPVEFSFPGGEGRALGANYAGGEGVLDLLHDVHVKLSPPPQKGKIAETPAPPVVVDGSSLEFQRKSRVMLLRGPVIARQQVLPEPARTASSQSAHSQNANEARELHASLLTVNFDKDLKANKITASGDAKERPQLRSTEAMGSGTVFADQFIADLAPAGWIEHFSAVGDVQGDYKSAMDTDHFAAARIDADMVPKLNQPKAVNATGAVRINSARSAAPANGNSGGTSTRMIETAALALDFAPGPPSRATNQPHYQLTHARSLAPATVTMSEPVTPQPGSTRSQAPQLQTPQMRLTHVSGQRIDADISDHNQVRKLQGHGGTQIDRDLPGAARQTSTSQDFAGEFDPQGQWTSFDQSGNVHLRQADHTGQGSRAQMDRATDTLTLSGPSAEASDASSRTTADSINFNQRTNDVRADGNVRSTYTGKSSASAAPANNAAGMGTALNLGSDPTYIASDHLTGNSVAGHAFYTGHARMWQGDSVVEADEIELNRPASQLDARGNVRAVFQSAPPSHPSAAPNGASASASAKPASSTSHGSSSSPKPAANDSGPDVWHIHTAKLTYYDSESRAHLDDGFTAESQQGFISGQNCDIYFVPSTQRAANPAGASQRIDHAIARGHVLVRQDDRHGTSERADYIAADGEFVLSGGKPTFFDGDGNSVTGNKLTFFQADDRILVESEEGVRTLTRHRVQK
jgi:lipopolysaccharide export system protein LptA